MNPHGKPTHSSGPETRATWLLGSRRQAAAAVAWFSVMLLLAGEVQAEDGLAAGELVRGNRAHLESLRVAGYGVLELKFSPDFPNPSLHLERNNPGRPSGDYETVTRVPMVGRERLVLAPGAYRITASSDGATPAVFEVALDPDEVVSYGLRPGERVMAEEVFWSIAAGAAIGIIAGYLLMTSAIGDDRIDGLRFSFGIGALAVGTALAALAWVFRDEREPSVVTKTGHLPAGANAL